MDRSAEEDCSEGRSDPGCSGELGFDACEPECSAAPSSTSEAPASPGCMELDGEASPTSEDGCRACSGLLRVPGILACDGTVKPKASSTDCKPSVVSRRSFFFSAVAKSWEMILTTRLRSLSKASSCPNSTARCHIAFTPRWAAKTPPVAGQLPRGSTIISMSSNGIKLRTSVTLLSRSSRTS